VNERKLQANPVIVKGLVDHLMSAYEDFINENDNVSYVDGFMAAHNFHCAIIFNLEKEAGMDADQALLFRQMAIKTFEERLRREQTPEGR
jgi:hypothetical protein